MNGKRFAWQVLILFAAAALMFGCGGNGESESGSNKSTVATSEPASQEMMAAGKETFEANCSACHGVDARGIEGIGKDLVQSDFQKNTGDDELLLFIKTGRDSTDPANTTGIMMPAKGGNPALTDEGIKSIIAYLRSLQK